MIGAPVLQNRPARSLVEHASSLVLPLGAKDHGQVVVEEIRDDVAASVYLPRQACRSLADLASGLNIAEAAQDFAQNRHGRDRGLMTLAESCAVELQTPLGFGFRLLIPSCPAQRGGSPEPNTDHVRVLKAQPGLVDWKSLIDQGKCLLVAATTPLIPDQLARRVQRIVVLCAQVEAAAAQRVLIQVACRVEVATEP